MWAAVPLKASVSAKSRLSGVLSPLDRRELYFLMARTVLASLKGAASIDEVLVVTSASEVAEFADGLGCKVTMQSHDHGLSSACRAAVARAVDAGAAALLIVPGDLPLISTSIVQELVAGATPGVTIVPDRNRRGTNALLCWPPDAIPMRFGSDSFSLHSADAKDRGLVLRVLEDPRLALDIDQAEDLERLCDVLKRCAASDLLEGWRSFLSRNCARAGHVAHSSQPDGTHEY